MWMHFKSLYLLKLSITQRYKSAVSFQLTESRAAWLASLHPFIYHFKHYNSFIWLLITLLSVLLFCFVWEKNTFWHISAALWPISSRHIPKSQTFLQYFNVILTFSLECIISLHLKINVFIGDEQHLKVILLRNKEENVLFFTELNWKIVSDPKDSV